MQATLEIQTVARQALATPKTSLSQTLCYRANRRRKPKKIGRGQVRSEWSSLVKVLVHYRHIRTLVEDVSSMSVGCSRFSRCCHLIFDLHFPREAQSGVINESPELGVDFFF